MISIPTALAVRFVANNNLKQRINVLQKSYKIQITGMGLFSSFEFINNVKPFILLNQPLLKNAVYFPL